MIYRASFIHCLTAIAYFACHGPAAAQDDGELNIILENDSFNPFTTLTDRYYTHGTRIEWLQQSKPGGEDFLPDVDAAKWCILCGDDAKEAIVRTGYAIGQDMYTPANIGSTRRQPFDRPFAGFLYGSRFAHIAYSEPSLNAQRRDRVELTLGVVGPMALAGEAQKLVHRTFDWVRPGGWRYQLRNEPILQLRYESALRWPAREGGNADIVPRIGANLGNANISVDAEVRGRIGFNLKGFGVGSSDPAKAAASDRRFVQSFALFARAKGSAIARNIFLDGNSFRNNDIRIRSKSFVSELGFGFETRLRGRFSLTAQFTRRSSEFRDFRGFDAPHQDYGSLTFGIPL
jgi:lipid A 3-O-deacylase